MSGLVLDLALGVAVIVFANLGLMRLARRSAWQAAATVALITLGLYVPYAILRWPGGDVFALHLALYLLASLACGLLWSRRASGQGLHWGPVVLSGFFIVVVVGGAVFVTIAERGLTPWLARWFFPETPSGAVSSLFPGVIARDFHKKESLYNDYLQQVQRQRQRGWQIQKGWLAEPVAGQATVFRVTAHTRDGVPVTGATVTGRFLRPSTSTLDVTFTLLEQQPGVYEAPLQLPVAGAWNLLLQVRQGDEVHEISANAQVAAR